MSDTVQRKFIVRNGGAATVVPPSNVISVSAGGNDATGTRGNAALPFLTFQAGLTVAQTGDQIRCGPGVQSLAAPLVWPVGLTALSIVGSGMDYTVIEAPGQSDAIVVPPTLETLIIEDLTVLAMGSTAVVADGTGLGGLFMPGGLFFRNARLTASFGLTASFVGRVTMHGVESVARLSFATCNFGQMENILVGSGLGLANIFLTWDDDSLDKPVAGRQAVIFRDTLAGEFLLEGQPSFDLFPGCYFNKVSGLSVTGLPASIGGLVARIGIHCTVDTVDFTAGGGAALPDAVNSCFFSCEGANFGQVTVEVAGAGTNPQTITAANCGIRSALTVSNNAHWVDHQLNATGGAFTTATGGTITPGSYSFTDAFSASPTTYTFPFLAGTAPDAVVATSDVVAPGVLAVTARTAASIDVSSTAAASGNVSFTASWG